MMSPHNPVRPTWTCGGCPSAWPCATRRAELLAEYAGCATSLAFYLGVCLTEAAHDLPHALAGELHRRFLGWLRVDQVVTIREPGNSGPGW
jgi:hypothetical protein